MMGKHSSYSLKMKLGSEESSWEASEGPGCCSGPIPSGWGNFGSGEPAAWGLCCSTPVAALARNIYSCFAPLSPHQPADWWFKPGMWSTQMSSSRRSLFGRIISLTTHFSLSVSWLHSRDLCACLVWGLTAATLLDPPWCILFSRKLIRGAITHSIGLEEKGVSYESCIWNEEKDLLSRMNFWGFLMWVSIETPILPCTEQVKCGKVSLIFLCM